MAVKKQENGSFWDHLEEFRRRILTVLVTVAVFAAVAFFFSGKLVGFVADTSPSALAALAPAEAITAHVKLSVTAAIIACSPVILFQIWRFVAPGLYRDEKKSVVAVTASGAFLFIAGAAFAWFIIREPALILFKSFETGKITGFWSVSSYMDFVGTLLLVFGTAFQLPLAVFFLVKTGIAEPADLAHYRKHILVGLLVIAAILTPPDPLTQIMLALPLYVLFELSLLVARIGFRKNRNKQLPV
jgi:sec-independent protein translocase protein TatC